MKKSNSEKGNRPADRGTSASIQDVARLARVSPATVSRVLNGSESVADESRRRVLAAVARVDYRPNRLARNLRRQQIEMVGVVVSDIENPHFSETVRVIEDEAYRAGYRVLLCNSDETVDKQRAYLQMLADERVGGVILSPADRLGSGIEALHALSIPIVAYDRTIDDGRVDSVVVDNVEGLRRATEHLIWLGHTRIAFVGGRGDTETGASRLEGYASTMRSSGLVPFTISGGFRRDLAEEEVTRLLASGPRPTALVVANNQMTLGALRALRRAGLKVPTDVAVIGVDDAEWAEVVDPPLTTVAQPVREMARLAMKLVRDRIERSYDGPARRVVLPVELKVRSSCGISGPKRRG